MKRKTREGIPWEELFWSLDNDGFAYVPQVLSPGDCDDLVALYSDGSAFRSTIDMQRYGFGLGEYKYLDYPLPHIVESLREEFYRGLVPKANEWMERLRISIRYPETLSKFLSLCRDKGQLRPTPLILCYHEGGFNTLHQDLYGEVYFPFQVVFMLAERGQDYDGGELVFVEQIPRAQSRASVLTPRKGDAVVFTTNFRPAEGRTGYYRRAMKHGVSTVRKGTRYTMGMIFHDAA